MKFPNKKTTYLFIFIFFWSSIWLSITCLGWTPTWKVLHIPTLSPMFADMRTVQGSLFSIQQGYNPQIENPGDPWGRAMNYPQVWSIIARFFHLGNESIFRLVVFSFIFAFLTSGFLLLRDFPSVYIMLTMFSGTTLLAVERGNNDLIVFSLLFVGIYASNHYQRDFVQFLTFLLATILKIYPVFAIVSFIKKPKLLFISIIATITYFVYIHNDLQVIKNGNTASGITSYGLENLIKLLPSRNFIFTSLIIFLSLLLLIVLIKILQTEQEKQVSSTSISLFITGGSIFTLTYIISPNYDYRLIFLLLCLPFIVSIQNKYIKHSTLVSILIISNIVVISNVFPIYLSAVLKHYVFLVILACFIIVLKSFLSSFSFTQKNLNIIRKKE